MSVYSLMPGLAKFRTCDFRLFTIWVLVRSWGMAKEHRIPMERGTYYSRNWLTIFDGGSDQWLYACRVGLTYVFVQIMDLPAYCGQDANSRWSVSVALVDLMAISPEAMASAMQSCGCDEPLDFKDESDRLRLAEMLFSHGSKSPAWDKAGGKVTFDNYGNCEQDYDENCPAFRSLRKEAREQAEELLTSESAREGAMDKVVNAIGQTAREYANGADGLWTSLRRIKEAGGEATAEQQMVLGMYQRAENTLGCGPVPEDLR